MAHESQNTTFQMTKEYTTFRIALSLTRRRLTKTRLRFTKHKDMSHEIVIHTKTPQLKRLCFLKYCCVLTLQGRRSSDISVQRQQSKQTAERASRPSAAVFPAGVFFFPAEESGGELPVKQNHYTVNPQSIFIWPRCKKLYKSKEAMELLEVDCGNRVERGLPPPKHPPTPPPPPPPNPRARAWARPTSLSRPLSPLFGGSAVGCSNER